MLRGLIGQGSIVSALRVGLDESASRLGAIANRVANATTPGYQDVASFSEDGALEPVDLQREMVALADESLRFDATARLLRMNYDLIRVSLRQG